MKFGNWIRALHTVLDDVLHPDPSTRNAGPEPKFAFGAPLEMYASSVSLNAPPSPFWNVSVFVPETAMEKVQMTACMDSSDAVLSPTTCPASLIPNAEP